MGSLPYILTILAVLFIATGQILFKITANRLAGRALLDSLTDSAVLLPFGMALVIYGIATVLWVIALQHVPLSRAYMFMALSFVIVPVVAMVLFGEQLSISFFLGLALILGGLVLTQTSS